MKKATLIVTLILIIVISTSTLVGRAFSAPIAYPVPTGPMNPPVISMESPTSMTYVSWFVPLKFSVSGNWNGYLSRFNVAFSLDDDAKYVIYSSPARFNALDQDFSITLGPLSEGIHHLQVFATVGGAYRTAPDSTTLAVNDFTSQSSIYFTVSTIGQAEISILSPQNETYNVNRNIPVDFAVNTNSSIESLGYTLDQQSNVTIPRNTTLYGPIPDGTHSLKVYSIFHDIIPVTSTINFTVDTTPPNVTIISLEEEQYNTSKIPLVFAVNETTSTITYVLDGQVSTLEGNTTLTILQDGDHKLTVYATDKVGNVESSQTVDFKVRVPIPPQVGLLILPPMAIVLIGGLSLLIYIEKHKQSAAESRH